MTLYHLLLPGSLWFTTGELLLVNHLIRRTPRKSRQSCTGLKTTCETVVTLHIQYNTQARSKPSSPKARVCNSGRRSAV